MLEREYSPRHFHPIGDRNEVSIKKTKVVVVFPFAIRQKTILRCDMNILEKLNEVRKNIEYIKKDAVVNNRYKAVTHDMVTAMVRDHLVCQGILVCPSLESSAVADTGTKTKGGTPIIRYEARYKVAFLNEKDPQDALAIIVEAHANDEGDKAPGKALSYATKNALLKVLSIETGENDEARIEAVPAAYTDQQKAIFDTLISQGDALGIAAFLGMVGDDAQTSLFNSFDKGATSSGKQMVRTLQAEGGNKWQSLLSDIETMMADEDSLGLKEATSELENYEKQYLAKLLGNKTAQNMGQLIKKAA